MISPKLAKLIEERLPGQKYGVFFSVGEGSFYPDGTEESSGFVAAEDGSHWFYWTGWQDGREVLADWTALAHDPVWEKAVLGTAEYQRALRAARSTAAPDGGGQSK